MGISCFIICLNEEKNLRRCLESVSWCNEVVIVDSGSTDQTLEIAKEFAGKVVYNKWQGFVKQKALGLSLCQEEWALNLDADEVVSPELRKEIEDVIGTDKADKKGINGFYLSRVVFYLGKWWRKGTWYPEYRLRLVRKSATVWGGNDPHEKALVKGKTASLKCELLHYSFRDISDQIARLNDYSTKSADNMFSRSVRFSLLKLFLRPLFHFIKSYIFKRGFREGLAGFTVACFEAYYVYLKYIKLWEHYQNAKAKNGSEV